MKTSDDFKRAIGPADEAFTACVRRTLTQCKVMEEEEPMKKKISTGLVLALVLLLAAAAALAAATQWGILDFLSSYNQNVLPDAANLIQKNVTQTGGVSELATFALREGLYDGNEVYMVIEAHPASENLLLLGPDLTPDDAMRHLGPKFEGNNVTINDYAASAGKTIVNINLADQRMYDGLDGVVSSIDYLLEEDGTLVLMVRGELSSEATELPIELICFANTTEDGAKAQSALDLKQTKLAFTLSSTPGGTGKQSAQSVVFADCGVEVDSVTLTPSALCTYVRIGYRVIDAEAFAKADDGLWFEFLDKNGARIEDGVGGGSVEPQDALASPGDGAYYVQTSSLAAMNELPQTLTLRGYNCWTKDRYEAHEVEIK